MGEKGKPRMKSLTVRIPEQFEKDLKAAMDALARDPSLDPDFMREGGLSRGRFIRESVNARIAAIMAKEKSKRKKQ